MRGFGIRPPKIALSLSPVDVALIAGDADFDPSPIPEFDTDSDPGDENDRRDSEQRGEILHDHQ